MATTNSTDVVDYLGEYRRYFEEFVEKINPEDQLPMKVNAHSITENELVGEIIYLTLLYIKQPRCPRSLQGYLVRLVLQEIKELCKKQPEECGFKLETKTYAPLKLMQTVTNKVNEIFTRYLDNNRLVMLPPPSSKLPPIARSAAFKNIKRKMEDRHIEIYDLHTICNVKNDSLASYFAVFDGHGGEDAAVYCATHLHQYLAESIYYPTDPERALCDAFYTTDTRFIEKDRTERVIGGSTAVCVLLLDKKLYIAWVGDSLAMLVKQGKVEELVYPHRLSRCDESERIQQMGGMLAFNQGTMRVNGVLAVSRAIGDIQYKPYVTSTPDTRCVPLDGTEDFLIIATDGVWDFISAQKAAAIIYIAIRQHPDNPDYAVTSLIKAAKYAGSLDNITAIVVFLTSPREIAARPTDLLSLDSKINMAVNHPYVQKDLCGIDGMFFKQMKQYQQHPAQYDNDQEERHANGSEASMDDGGFHDEITAGAEGKQHEENDAADYIYGDLGPETDVDAVDDVDNAALENPILDNAPTDPSQMLFHEEKRLPENDFRQQEVEEEEDEEEDEPTLDDAPLDTPHDVPVGAPLDDEDSPPSPVNNDIKPLQHALLPEADNVADSEDSEDEWNYYRVGPNKEKDTAASAGEINQEKNDNEQETVHLLDEDNNVEPQSPASEDNSECESQKEEIPRELINTEISVEEKREEELDSPLVKADKEKEEEQQQQQQQQQEQQEEEEGETEEEEEEKEEHGIKDEKKEEEKEKDIEKEEDEEDMEFRLNPNAAEFIPGCSPPKQQIKLSTIKDSLLAGSPMKSMAMDDIKIPSEKEFDEEISARPRELQEKSSPNGDHMSHSDYDFFTERQKTISAPIGLDESEISSTKAEYGDESTMSSLYTTDLHRTAISTMEDSFGESECNMCDRDNLMTMSYTPCDFKAAFKKEVDLNAVHDLSDGDLEEENGSFEEQSPSSPIITTANIESSVFSNGESADPVQSYSGSLTNETAFLKFEESGEPKTTEFMQVELERHQSHQSSPIDSAYGREILKKEEESLLADDGNLVNLAQDEENEQVETHKEAEYIEDEKDIAENDVASETEQLTERQEVVEITAADIAEYEIPEDEVLQDYNFLSSTTHEAAKSVSSVESTPKSVSPIGTERMEVSSKPFETDITSSMENLVLDAEEEASCVAESTRLRDDVPEFIPTQSSLSPLVSGEELLSNNDSMDLMAEPTAQSEHQQHVEHSFVPSLVPESASDERPVESLVEFSDVVTEMPTKDHIDINDQTEAEKEAVVETEESLEKQAAVEEAVENLVEETEKLNLTEVEKVHDMPMLNLSESIQEFTGLEKQLEPENVTPEESPVTEPKTIEDKIAEAIVDTKDHVVEESIDEKMIFDMKQEEKEEQLLKTEDSADIVHLEETTEQPIDKIEITAPSNTDFMAPIDNIEIETSADIIEVATAVDSTEVGTPIDTAEMATPVETAEIAMPVDATETVIPSETVETPVPAETAAPADIGEVATLADMAKAASTAAESNATANIAEDLSTNLVDRTSATKIEETVESVETIETSQIPMISSTVQVMEEEQKVPESGVTANIAEDLSMKLVDTAPTTKIEETVEKVETVEATKIPETASTVPSTEEEQKVPEIPQIVESKVEEVSEQAPPAIVAGAVAAAAAAATVGGVAALASNASKPKAKPAAKTTKLGISTKTTLKSTPTSPSKTVSSTTRPASSTTMAKKNPTSTAARPKQLDTTATKTTASSSTTKASATKTTSASRPATTTTKTVGARPASATTKPKPFSTTAKSTSSGTAEKKSVVNGDVKSLSKGTTTKTATSTKSTIGASASVTASASGKTGATKTTAASTKVSSTTTTTTIAKSRPSSATTAAKSPAKMSLTNPSATKPRTPTTNSVAKPRTTVAKSPMIDKEVKETANKQISMGRTTSASTASKTTRTSVSSTTTSNFSTTKRLSTTKSTTTTAHSPVKKIVSKVGASGTKTSTATKVTKVMQNGTADNVEITKTTIITNIKNEDDVPKKDLSPVVEPTDNQLIVSAD